jgi:hypothetical protein
MFPFDNMPGDATSDICTIISWCSKYTKSLVWCVLCPGDALATIAYVIQRAMLAAAWALWAAVVHDFWVVVGTPRAILSLFCCFLCRSCSTGESNIHALL